MSRVNQKHKKQLNSTTLLVFKHDFLFGRFPIRLNQMGFEMTEPANSNISSRLTC